MKGQRFAALANSLTKKAPYKETAGGVAKLRVRRYGDFAGGGLLAGCIDRLFGKQAQV